MAPGNKFLRVGRLLLGLVLITACSLDYEDTMLADDISEEIPNTVLFNFKQVNVENGIPTYEIAAEQGSFYQTRKLAELNAVSFREFDATGATVTEGFAEKGTYFTDTENAEMEGKLFFHSVTEKAEIQSDYLYYNKEEKKITGKPENTIVIVKESGSRIEGQGLSIDLRTREMKLTQNIQGTWSEEDDEPEN